MLTMHKQLHYTIESDEFSNIAKNYCPSTDLQHFSSAISILDELAGNTEIDSSDGELYSMLKELGNFSAELYFSLKTPTKQDVERFCYNYSALSDRYDEGVVLYRNAFSIASFDGEKDWLGLNQRSRKSPAAATHPTGAWRVRANQLSGKVEIDMFPEIEQEACLVYLTNENQGLPYISYRQYAKLDSKTPILESRIERNKPLKKWSNAVLSDEEIDLLNRITNQYTTIAKLSDSAPGIVTGANNKFILTKEEVDQYECAQYVKPIISKGIMAKNKFEVNHALISELASAGKKVYLLDLVGTKPDELPVSLKNYLSIVASTKRNGVEIQKSYKCSKRKPWYGVPIVKSGRVIFFKRYDLCPRISTNPAEIYTTDIAYNLRLHEGIDPESLVFCFYNSLTLAQCEVVGRYYAGGVSELTPNEFRTISVPYRQIKPCDIERVKTMFSNNVNLNQIVAFVNSKTLESDLTTEEISRLNTIRVKLIGRRK